MDGWDANVPEVILPVQYGVLRTDDRDRGFSRDLVLPVWLLVQ